MRKVLLCALLASSLALPAAAQPFTLEGVLIEPRHPTTSDRILLTVVGRGACVEFHPVYEEATGSVVVQLKGLDCVIPILRDIDEPFDLGPLPAGLHFVEIPTSTFPAPGAVPWRELFEVREETAPLKLGEDFHVSVHWSNPRDGASGTGRSLRLARDSGGFWFFSPDNLEVTVKILDGRAINGHWWVFIASMTDLQFEVEISRAGGPAKTYVQTAGANRNFVDVNATFEEGTGTFLTVPDIAVDPEHPTAADLVRIELAVFDMQPSLSFTGMDGRRLVFDYSGSDHTPPPLLRTFGTTVGPLAPGVYRVDLRRFEEHQLGRSFEVTAATGPELRLRETDEDHFEIGVRYRLPGETAFANARPMPLTRDAGTFYFFDPGNVEVTAKIVDGRAVNGHWWVFLANMTTVEMEIAVTRCPPEGLPLPCVEKTYVQPPGQNVNFLDIDFF